MDLPTRRHRRNRLPSCQCRRTRFTPAVQTLETRRLLAAEVCLANNLPAGQASGSLGEGESVFYGPLRLERSASPLATVTETNHELNIADASVVEEHAGATTLRFDVTLSETSTEAVTVDVSTVGLAGANAAQSLRLERLATGLVEPVYLTSAPGDPNTLYVIEQDGFIRLVDRNTGTVSPTPFLTVSNLSRGGERGLLGLAFHPQYETNRLFYVYTTDSSRDTLIREFQARPDGLTADPNSERSILAFDQPFGNHNGGWIDFGPDGYLYIASGDGGSANDPGDNAQDITNNLLGKMLRIDINGDDFPADPNSNYAIPPDNPFVGVSGDDEIWSYGLRNPWRNSFDRDTGDLLIADVGQNIIEEINFQPADSAGGENYGWRDREGTVATPSVGGPKPPGAIDPIYEYRHGNGATQGNSVTGGYVYRGPIRELQGQYFFADFVNPRIWSLRPTDEAPANFDGTNFSDFTDWTSLLTPDAGSINNVSSFGEDSDGNLYILEYSGQIFRLTGGGDYLDHSETLTFEPGETSKTFEVTILGDRLPEAHEIFEVQLTGSVGATIADGVAQGTITNDDAAEVVGLTVGDGTPGRSRVEQVVVTFDAAVDLDQSQGSPFQVIHRGTSDVVNHSIAESIVDGQSVVTLQFMDGPSTEPSGSQVPPTLSDGNYELVVIASRVSTAGVNLDGNGDQQPGDNHHFGTVATDQFFRFYGDVNGDRDVDGADYGAFGAAFLTRIGQPGYNAKLDSDADGDIDGQDYARLGTRFLQTLPFA